MIPKICIDMKIKGIQVKDYIFKLYSPPGFFKRPYYELFCKTIFILKLLMINIKKKHIYVKTLLLWIKNFKAHNIVIKITHYENKTILFTILTKINRNKHKYKIRKIKNSKLLKMYFSMHNSQHNFNSQINLITNDIT